MNRKIRVKFYCSRCRNEVIEDYDTRHIFNGTDLNAICFACAEKDEFRGMRGEILDIEKSHKCKTCKEEYEIKFGDADKNRIYCPECLKKQDEKVKPKVTAKAMA